MGSGMYGAVASYQVPDGEPNGGVWVAVKQLTSLVAAEKEYEAHMKAWNKMTEACRKYLAMPACMEMPEDEDVPDGKIYLVQMLVNKLPFEDPPSSGLVAYPPAPASVVTDTFATVSALWHLVLQKTNQETKFMIAAQYGDMLACLALAKMRHGDLHGNNILVTHNLKAFKYSWGAQMRMRIYFRFHVIDWGFGTPISSESYQTNGIPKAICTWKDLNFAYNPKYQKPSDDWNQEDWRVMFAVLEETEAAARRARARAGTGCTCCSRRCITPRTPSGTWPWTASRARSSSTGCASRGLLAWESPTRSPFAKKWTTPSSRSARCTRRTGNTLPQGSRRPRARSIVFVF